MECIYYGGTQLTQNRFIDPRKLAQKIPLHLYSLHLAEVRNRPRVYHSVALSHYDFRNMLMSSARLTYEGAYAILERRTVALEVIRQKWIAQLDQLSLMEQRLIDKRLEAYPLGEAVLSGIALDAIRLLLPDQAETEYLVNVAEIAMYYRQLGELVNHISADIMSLNEHFASLGVSEFPTKAGLRDALETTQKEIQDRLATIASHDALRLATENVETLIGEVHFSNMPYLWADVLAALGHSDIRVTDRSGDGNRDVESTHQGSLCYTQVKAWGQSLVGTEIIRQFAGTCRTYGVKKGYFVTSNRFVRGAELGQWPQMARERLQQLKYHCPRREAYAAAVMNEAMKQDKIASIELIDRERLALLVVKYRIGATADAIDVEYWAGLRTPRFRSQVEYRLD